MGAAVMTGWQILLLSVFLLSQLKIGESETEDLEHQDALYSSSSVEELLGLCSDLNDSSLVSVPGRRFKQCPNTTCIKFCDSDRLGKLREAQERVSQMMLSLDAIDRVLMHFIAFFLVIAMGCYLIVAKHFSWRTLPVVGSKFEIDHTDGYRFGHYIWMRWIILDSNHPAYYIGMNANTHELEYISQHKEWKDPDKPSEVDVEPSWSAKDICDLTFDPNERLGMYFKRVQMNSSKHHNQR